jgi:hypothetical protein
MSFVELNPDQRREAINTRQRFQAWRDAVARQRAYRGSMVWSRTKGRDYLARVAYDGSRGRRQTSLGARDERTESVKAEFERARAEAIERVEQLRPVLARQIGVNRVLGLGRVPLLSARILRALDAHGLLGAGLRVVGTHAIYAFEAAAGVHVDSGLTTTEDVDLLLDSRRGVSFIASEDVETASLLKILRKVDKSFSRSRQEFRAVNKTGYLVDLIKPLRNPPRAAEATKVGDDPDDLSAAGLAWHESASAFEAIAIDERGEPLRIVTSDPRVFVTHKYWAAAREDREPIKRRRDREQAVAIAELVATYLPHLPFEADALRMLPKELFSEVEPLFVAREAGSEFEA